MYVSRTIQGSRMQNNLILLPPTQERTKVYYGRPAGWLCLRFNEAQALAWRFSVSSWGGSTTLAASAVYKPDHGASPQVHPIRPASDRLLGLPSQGHVRLFTGWGAPQPPKPPGLPRPGRGSRPTGARADSAGVSPSPPRTFEGCWGAAVARPLPLHPRRSRNRGYSSRRPRCSACACDCPDSNRSHGRARRHQSPASGRSPQPQKPAPAELGLALGGAAPGCSASPWVTAPRDGRECTSGSPTQTVSRHGPATTASLHRARVAYTATFSRAATTVAVDTTASIFRPARCVWPPLARTAGPHPLAFATKRGTQGACARRASGRGGGKRAYVQVEPAQNGLRAGTGQRVCCPRGIHAELGWSLQQSRVRGRTAV